MLLRADVPGPYVLVGHSSGGLTVRVFAHAHAADVAGIVLIESMNPSGAKASPPATPPPRTQPPQLAGGAMPSAPDPSTVSARLKNLVVSIGQVDELSRRAREAPPVTSRCTAASPPPSISSRRASRRLGTYPRRRRRSTTVRSAARRGPSLSRPSPRHDVEQAFAALANAWRHQAETFLTDHPDVELLLAEQHEQDEEARRREVVRARAQHFQELIGATDAALRQGQLDDARECLKLLGREFPGEAARLAPLQERLDHRVRAANDAAARRTLLQAAELQGRGDFEAAVRLLEAVDVRGLSREVSEDVFGRWSAACSCSARRAALSCFATRPARAAASFSTATRACPAA